MFHVKQKSRPQETVFFCFLSLNDSSARRLPISGRYGCSPRTQPVPKGAAVPLNITPSFQLSPAATVHHAFLHDGSPQTCPVSYGHHPIPESNPLHHVARAVLLSSTRSASMSTPLSTGESGISIGTAARVS
jgi:hypothetical protein